METPFILTFTIMFTLLFFIVGGIVAWLAKDYFLEKQYIAPNLHPEMFDQNGNFIPDEILAVRFENEYDTDEDEDE